MDISPEPHTRCLPIFVVVAYIRGSVVLRHVYDRPHRLSLHRKGFSSPLKMHCRPGKGVEMHSAGEVCYLYNCLVKWVWLVPTARQRINQNTLSRDCLHTKCGVLRRVAMDILCERTFSWLLIKYDLANDLSRGPKIKLFSRILGLHGTKSEMK